MPPILRCVRAALLLAALALCLPVASAYASDPNVAALQVALKAVHTYHGRIDGIAGRGTHRAIRAFQAKKHLSVDGVAGPRTRRALGRRGRPRLGSRVMRRGQRGWDVAALQFLLARRGFSSGSIDGGFGPGTYAAVRRFQSAHGLGVDGVVGRATLHALEHGSSGGSSHSHVGTGTPSGPVRFLRPAHGPITSPFGMRWGRPHQGIDFGAPYGAPVNAAGVGTVISAGWNSGGYGNLVIIQHRLSFQTYYAHMSRIAVSVGQRVAGGSRVGYVGATGHATGPHLHFEVRHYGVPIDPMPYLLSAYSKALPVSPLTSAAMGCDTGLQDPAWLAAC
jgi:peptidoglycan hydrolase-like protein with peptidoglycan-binding domain